MELTSVPPVTVVRGQGASEAFYPSGAGGTPPIEGEEHSACPIRRQVATGYDR